MAEIIPKVSPERGIELVEHRAGKPHLLGMMTPPDGAYLARGMLACAAALSGPNPPAAGEMVGDLHLPVTKWTVAASSKNGEPVLILTIPSGIELTFQLTRHGAQEIGAALVAQAQGTARLWGHSGTMS